MLKRMVVPGWVVKGNRDPPTLWMGKSLGKYTKSPKSVQSP